jgi:NAD(P)-dependent dehydrogenase (short-subunit alcohol dehydrogenase family)
MTFDFKDKVVVITGATRGIGKQVADDLAALGAKLILTGTDKKQMAQMNKEAASQGLRRTYYQVDFSNAASVKVFLKELSTFKKIDVCINNAGINRINGLEETKEKDWDDMMAVNLKGPYLMMRSVAPLMKKNGYGRIVNIASIFGVVSKSKRSIYSTTKFGLRGMTMTVSNEMARYGVLVNAVSPGFVLTDLTRKNLSPKERKEISSQIPMGRMAVPADISRVIIFLASDLNTYLTGKNIVVDGGFIDV